MWEDARANLKTNTLKISPPSNDVLFIKCRYFKKKKAPNRSISKEEQPVVNWLFERSHWSVINITYHKPGLPKKNGENV